MPPEPSTTLDDASFENDVKVLLDNLPAPVRAFVVGKGPDKTVLSLTRKYQLHTDQAGELHKALLMMLLGVYSPSRFATTLEDKDFSEETVEGIIADLNEQVFAPLRKEEREETAPNSSAAKKEPLAPVPAPLNPIPQAPTPTAPVVPVPTPKPVPPPSPAVSAPLAPPPTPSPSYEPTMRTMAHDIEGMKDGHAPAPVPHQIPGLAHPAVAPAVPMPPTPVPITVPPVAPSSAHPDPTEVRTTLQKYGIDPYRESVD